jgi:cardiolipin synthase
MPKSLSLSPFVSSVVEVIEFMKMWKAVTLILCGLALVFVVAGFFFVFNPLGLGPEPDEVLSRSFFAAPAGNLDELELLVDGEFAFNEIISAIDATESSIFVQTFIWKDDNIGNQIVNKLKAAADRGVSVTIRKDLLGTVFELGDMLKGRPSPVFTQSGLRGYDNIDVDTEMSKDTDHSKYFIVDNRVVIFGGMNIADEYHTKWHDYMALIRSKRWTEAFEEKVIKSSAWPYPAPFVMTVNDRNVTEIRTAVIEMLDNAKESIIIEHAYFSDDKVIKAVKRAAARGVGVDVVLPKTPDTHIYANMLTTNKLLKESNQKVPRIFLYPKMSHAKVMMTDGVIACVGSANLTPRSMLTSREITLFAHGRRDERFIKELRDQLEADIALSEQVLEPYELSFSDRLKGLVGKYLW